MIRQRKPLIARARGDCQIQHLSRAQAELASPFTNNFRERIRPWSDQRPADCATRGVPIAQANLAVSADEN